MKTNTIIGIILIAAGIIALTFQGITYATREKAIDLGPIQVTTEKTRRIPLPPIAGAIAMAGGLALLIAGNKKNG